jgi:type I restriction enzyme S subunit
MSSRKFSLHQINEEQLPVGWKFRPVGSVLTQSQYGSNARSGNVGAMAIVGMKDISEGLVNMKNLARVELDSKECEAYLLEKGDLLLNRTNSYDLVGKVGIYDSNAQAVFASYLVRLKVNRQKISPWFLNYWLNSYIAQKAIKRIATRAVGQANVNPTEFKRHCYIPLPGIEEQNKIVALLRIWDSAIGNTEKLLKAIKLRHKILSIKLLGNKPNETPIKKFLRQISRAIKKPDEPYWALGIRSHGKGTFRRFIENTSAVAMETLYRVKHDDIIVNITFAWEGAIALVDKTDEDCLVSHRFPTFEIDRNKALPEYLRHIIVQKRFIKNLGLISPGGAGRNRVLNKRDFLNLKISLPEIGEQQRIGDILNTSLREISLLQKKLELLKKQKSGLMQKLFTGEWRVKTTGEVT